MMGAAVLSGVVIGVVLAILPLPLGAIWTAYLERL